jgi:hypothetical protein
VGLVRRKWAGRKSHAGLSSKLLTLALLALMLTLPSSLGISRDVGITPAVSVGGLPPAPSSPAALLVCGQTSLQGPATQPAGSVLVPAGDDSSVLVDRGQLPPHVTYYFAAGTHWLGTAADDEIVPGSGDVFTGAPGAVLTGGNVNRYALFDPGGARISNVTVSYLTVEHFAVPFQTAAIGTGAWSGWTMTHLTVEDNYPGSGVDVTTDGTLSESCLSHNGQYGFYSTATQNKDALTGGASAVTATHDEVSYNDACNLEGLNSFPVSLPTECSFPKPTSGAIPGPGCGCDGGFKFWKTNGSLVTDLYVHNNFDYGMWWDTDNNGAVAEDNYDAANWMGGLLYEVSTNAIIENNTFSHNAWQPLSKVSNPGFPSGAVFISGSGGDPSVEATDVTTGLPITTLTISGNQFLNNWSGVVLFQDANRFCGAGGSLCTLTDPATYNAGTCTAANLQAATPDANPDYFDGCQWKLENVHVTANMFEWSPSSVPNCIGASNMCGLNAFVFGKGTAPAWSPYLGSALAGQIFTGSGVTFDDNLYEGPWKFGYVSAGTASTNTTGLWQSCPADTVHDACQDVSSTFR